MGTPANQHDEIGEIICMLINFSKGPCFPARWVITLGFAACREANPGAEAEKATKVSAKCD
jgi:hypothetical protein